MSLNAVETFQTNYVMFWLNTSSAGGAVMTVVSGAASVIGFLVAGPIADKIGRKWTIFTGICVVALCYLVYAFIPQVSREVAEAKPFESSLPWLFFILLPTIGLGSSLIHICSFPLVTDYCTGDKLGRYTSLYYTASMLAQSVTPILIGFIFRFTSWQALPIYSCSLMVVAGAVFFFVKAPHKNDKSKNVKGLEALGNDD
jgi:MFS family permease